MAVVAVSQFVYDESLEPLRAAGHELVARSSDVPPSPTELAALVADADALICLLTDPVDRALIESAPNLRVIANVAAGYDNIDVDAASDAGIVVCNTPGVLHEATADLTMALLLSAARRIPEGDRYLRDGRYRYWTLDQPQIGLDVHGMTLGLFGCGEIGRAVARRASHGFDMTVRYHTRTRLDPAVEAAIGASWVEFDELVETADFLSLHAPSSRHTRHVIDADVLARMRPSAVLVNTARGPLVDEAALAEALLNGTIAGAGIDVFEAEPEVHADLLRARDRVTLLPHLGSATEGTRRRMASLAADNVLHVLAGRGAATPVNPAP